MYKVDHSPQLAYIYYRNWQLTNPANPYLQIPSFNKAGDSDPREETLADIIAQQQKLYLKVTLGSPPEQADLLKLYSYENPLADLKSVSRKSNNPTTSEWAPQADTKCGTDR